MIKEMTYSEYLDLKSKGIDVKLVSPLGTIMIKVEIKEEKKP
jgi:hypothetical protein